VSSSSPQYSESLRQWVHIGFGAVALLLPFLTWYQAVILAAAAIVFNIRLLRKVAGERLHRPLELQQAVPAGLVLYPTSILLMLLMLPARPDIVAAAWGILAVGDGAATLVGRRVGGVRWPWNRQKTVAGSIALALAGGAAGSFLCWWCRSSIIPPPYPWFSVGAPIAAAMVAAAVETVPIRLDDNLSVPLSAASVLWAMAIVSEDLAVAALAALPGALVVALPANAIVAAAGYAARTVSVSGALVGAAIGTLIQVCAGWQGWVLLLTSFLCAAVTSRIGLQRKTLLGIAEERQGRRGAGNAIANTGVAAAAAILAVLSYGTEAGMIAMTAALVAGASDTVASEIGKAWGTRTWALMPPRSVRPGTPGAMSIEGTAAGLVGAAGLAGLAVALAIVPGWAALPIVIGATAGALAESLLAAAFEPSGVLNNDALNLLNTAIAAYAAVSAAGLVS
jgi:uncharacterized protein (TIGR00297 family)